MDLSIYKLRSELFGHTKDVKSVREGPNNTILSCSRDQTCKMWKCDGEQNFIDSVTFTGHSNFVNAICFIKDRDWICTGSNDSLINVYQLTETLPILVLKGHSDTVCTLASTDKQSTILSGSWDKTAKLWTVNEKGYSCVTFAGHEGAVWAVCELQDGRYATGSLKLISIWNSLGQKLLVLKGHEDCIRGLVSLKDGSLLSVSNDTTIRHWSSTWDCIRVFQGHTSFIYTIAISPIDENFFATGGEDGTIRLWNTQTGEIGESLRVPAQSVWSVSFLSNNDIVTGTSDAVVRIFTTDSAKYASADIIAKYENAITEQTKQQQPNPSSATINIDDLQGPESLPLVGREGQTKIIRNGDKIGCYKWSDNKWEYVGEIIDSKDTSNKTFHNNKYYDYVFSVDIKEGEPPLKLPYNIDEDPWEVARKFIEEHNLSMVFLDEVVNFILKNSGTSTFSTQSPFYSDPFTGDCRYVPGSLEESKKMVENNDSHSDLAKVNFPITVYQLLQNYDIEKIRLKLLEFNIKVEKDLSVPKEDLEKIVFSLTNSKDDIECGDIKTLKSLYRWPSEYLFPVLDITRLAIKNESVCSKIANFELLDKILESLSSGSIIANKIMATRCLVNLITHRWGRGLFEAKFEMLCNAVSSLKDGNASLQNCMAALYFNLSITQVETAVEDKSLIITKCIVDFLYWATQQDSVLRAYEALSNLTTIVYKANIIKLMQSSPELTKNIEKYAEDQTNLTLQATAKYLQKTLKTINKC